MLLSDKDKKILASLIHNPEQSLSNIGRIVGLSHVSVRSHVNKMKSQKILKIGGLVNPNTLGLEIVLLFVQLETEEKREIIIKRYKQCPRVFFVFSLIDSFEICVILYLEDRGLLELLRNNKSCLTDVPGVKNFRVVQTERWISPEFLPILLHFFPTSTSVTPCNLICQDCENYRFHTCVGCPAVKEYRGKLRIEG